MPLGNLPIVSGSLSRQAHLQSATSAISLHSIDTNRSIASAKLQRNVNDCLHFVDISTIQRPVLRRHDAIGAMQPALSSVDLKISFSGDNTCGVHFRELFRLRIPMLGKVQLQICISNSLLALKRFFPGGSKEALRSSREKFLGNTEEAQFRTSSKIPQSCANKFEMQER